MAKYIDKDALVAEIVRKITEVEKMAKTISSSAITGLIQAYKNTLSFIDSLQEEPISIDFEQELYKAFGQVKDFTLGMQIAKWFYDMGRKHPEIVSEDLEIEIEKYFNVLYRNWTKEEREKDADVEEMCRQTARHFTEWQKNKMIEDATDVTVHIDAGGYPYIPQLELYDYDKDIPLAKEGDKYKVILIKEE